MQQRSASPTARVAGNGHRAGTCATHSSQRGIAALALTVLLFFAMVLGIGFVNRNLVFEQRASANQYRSTQAFEAAEAGLEWAVAKLGHNGRIGDDCLPTHDPSATSFRLRHLTWIPATAAFAPVSWSNGGTTAPLQPSCVHGDEGWTCSCPSNAAPDLTVPVTTSPAPAFVVRFQSGPQPGLVRVSVVGCSSLGGPCAPAGGSTTDATAQLQMLVGLVPALRTAPSAALTVRGAVAADAGGIGVHNRDPASGGLGIHAGAGIGALPARITVPAGSSSGGVLADHDTALAALTPDRFFTTYFGLDRAGWSALSTVHRITCSGDCGAAIQAAIDSDDVASSILVEGNAAIAGPATFGSPTRPILIVATGALQLAGAVTVHGVVYGGSVSWSQASANGALVRGAVLSESDYGGDGTPDIVYDTDVLKRLRSEAGVFARVHGSWKDF